MDSVKEESFRTDELSELDYDELDDEFEPQDTNGEENESVGPLQRPMISLYGLKSPTTTLMPSLGAQMNGSLSPAEKSRSLSNLDSTGPLSPGCRAPNCVSPSTSGAPNHHNWKYASMRSCSHYPNGLMLRPQLTLDESTMTIAKPQSLKLDLGPKSAELNGYHNLNGVAHHETSVSGINSSDPFLSVMF